MTPAHPPPLGHSRDYLYVDSAVLFTCLKVTELLSVFHFPQGAQLHPEENLPPLDPMLQMVRREEGVGQGKRVRNFNLPPPLPGNGSFPPSSPRRLQSRISTEKQQEQEAQLEEIRTRMGWLSFGKDQEVGDEGERERGREGGKKVVY